MSDFTLAMVAVGAKVVQFVWAAFSAYDWMVFLCLPLMIASSMFVPALKSILSKLIEDDEVGKIFGLAAIGETISGLLGALMFTAVYGASVHVWKGIAFILEAVVNVIVFCVLFWLAKSFVKTLGDLHTRDIGPRKDPLTVQVDNNYEFVPPAAASDPEVGDDGGFNGGEETEVRPAGVSLTYTQEEYDEESDSDDSQYLGSSKKPSQVRTPY